MKGLLAGILILVLLGLGSAFINTQKQAANPLPSNTLTYTSEAGGVSFAYPDTYNVQERADSYEGSPITVITLIDKNAVIPDMSEGPPAIAIVVVPNASSTPLEAWVKTKSISNFALSPSQKLYPVMVDGAEALNYTHSGLYESDAIAVAHGGRVYLFSVGSTDTASQINKDFQNLLKTVDLK